MAPTPARQHYGSHRRWNPLVHFVLSPLLIANVGVAVALFLRARTPLAGWGVAVAVLLVLLNLAARQQALTVQNRVIRLEMWWRLARVLPPELAARVDELRLGQLVGLRFAPDAELPDLVRRCLAGELPTNDAVKRAVRDWRPDTLRA
jgi:hypothetical protein